MVRLGLFNLMGLYDRNTSAASVLRTTVDMVCLAEELGFDIAWFAEHHFTNHSICPSSLMMVAHCAPETSRIRLGPGVLALPFYQPLRVVQELAFADLLTRGRLVLGLGSGYQPYEFERYQIAPDERYQRMLETWTIIEQGLTTGTVEFAGKHYQIPRTELSMRPFGLAMPEVFVASSNAEVLARMVQGGHTPFMSFGHRGLGAASQFRELIAQRWATAGGDIATMPLAIQRYIYITDSAHEASHAASCVRNLARAALPLSTAQPSKDGPFLRLMPLNDEPPLDDFLENAIIGSANYCAERLQYELETLRPSHLSCFMGFAGIGRRETLSSMERFGCDVMPQLGSLLHVCGPTTRDAA